MEIKQSSEKRFALLIDADNVSAKYIKPITDELSKYGTVTYKRIYGDWTLTLHSKWKDALLENSITPIQQFGYTQGKNATDSAMIIDAMDILYTKSVEGFCIVSSDSDFTRLASRIRESGLTVVGMGEKKTPTAFRKACDIFTTLELLLGDASPKQNGRSKGKSVSNGSANAASSGPGIEEIEQAVVNIITDNQNNGKSTGLGEVGSRLLKRYPDFDVRSYGTNLLSKLLDEFASVQITKERSSVTVELVSEGKEKEAGDKDEEARKQPEKADRSRNNAPREGSSKVADVESASGVAEASAEVLSDRPVETPQDASKGSRTPRRRLKRAPARRDGEISSESEGSSSVSVPTGEAASETDEMAAVQAEVDSSSEPSAAVSADVQPESAVVSETASTPARRRKRAPKADQQMVSPGDYARQLVREAGSEGIALSELGKRVRAAYRTFKVRDLGYSQFKNYVADLDDIAIERRGKEAYARLAE